MSASFDAKNLFDMLDEIGGNPGGSTMKAIHKHLGEVEIDEACLRLDKLDAIGDERHVIYEGDIRKVTASQICVCDEAETLAKATMAILLRSFSPEAAAKLTPGGLNYEAAKADAKAALEAADVLALLEGRERIGAALFRHGYDTGWTTEEAVACIEAMGKRIEELETDTARLRFLIDESGMDGFSDHDAHDFIQFVMDERGHDEPTDDDMLDGWRRLLDRAMQAQKGAGGGE